VATTVNSSGQVYMVQHRETNELYVSKRIPLLSLGEQEKRAALQEANLLRNLKHPHIVQYVDSFIEESSLVIIMEYCSGQLIRRGLSESY